VSYLIQVLDAIIALIVKEIGVDGARQTLIDRIEIAAARAAADAEAAARFGQVPPGT
jgi:hypothetical protein